MKTIWEKIKIRIKKVFVPNEQKGYLDKLIQNVKEAQKKDQALPFQILTAKHSGFVVKVGGLYGFVSFNYMPWKYKSIEHWRAVSGFLIHESFSAKIYKISGTTTPVSIILNAENHPFPSYGLIKLKKYKGVVIQESKYGLFVDLGYHDHWKYGSFVGLIHKSAYGNDKSLREAKPGDLIKTYFYGRTKAGEIKLGNIKLQKEWLTGELESLIGTIQTAIVMEDKTGKKQFYIDGKYKTTIFIEKDTFPNKKSIQKELKGLKASRKVRCSVDGIGKKYNFISKLLEIEPE